MITVAVSGGSTNEILELAHLSQNEFEEEVYFKIFDVEPNVAKYNLSNWEYRKCNSEKEMIHEAVKSTVKNESDIIFKGRIKTHDLLKEILKKEHKLKNKEILSHVALVHMPFLDRPILLSDAGMNIIPTEEQLKMIIQNAAETAQNIGLDQPKIALLSAAENINPKMPSSVLAKNITEYFEEQEKMTVYGPLSLDLSLSKKAVAHKMFSGPIQGDADILIVPNIDVGNVLYKSMMLFGEATVGGAIVGTKVPIVLTSRSDKVKSKLYALEFALKQIKNN